MPEGIEFHTIYHQSTFSDLYANEFGRDDDDNYASNDNWKDKTKHKEDVKLLSDTTIDEDNLRNINDIDEGDELYLNNGIANEVNQHNHFGPDQHEDQQNHFVVNQDGNQDNPNMNDGDEDNVDNNVERDQAVQDNNNIIPKTLAFLIVLLIV